MHYSIVPPDLLANQARLWYQYIFPCLIQASTVKMAFQGNRAFKASLDDLGRLYSPITRVVAENAPRVRQGLRANPVVVEAR